MSRTTLIVIGLFTVINLIVAFGFLACKSAQENTYNERAVGQDDDDDTGAPPPTGDDDTDCDHPCSGNAQCITELGAGYICKDSCCVKTGGDDDTMDDDATDDDAVDDDATDDDDDNDDDSDCLQTEYNNCKVEADVLKEQCLSDCPADPVCKVADCIAGCYADYFSAYAYCASTYHCDEASIPYWDCRSDCYSAQQDCLKPLLLCTQIKANQCSTAQDDCAADCI